MTVAYENIMQSAESGDASTLRDEMRYKSLTNLYYFSKVVLRYQELTAKLHLPFCKWIQDTVPLRFRGALMPRGHFKSTIVSKSYPLWSLIPIAKDLLEKFPELEQFLCFHNPDDRVLIVGESEDVGKKNLKDIKHNITNNQMLQWLFPEIIPEDLGKVKWTDTEIELPRSRSYDESSITCIGVGAKTTGKHYDKIIYDDLVGEKAAKSEAEMEAAKHWFKFAPGLANDPATVEELFIGTRWKAGEADLYGYVMATLPSDEDEVAQTKELATNEGERTAGFVWYIRSAIEPDPRTGEPVPIFPERFSMQTLNAIRRREGEYAFSCNYLNDPIAAGVTDFDPAWLKEYTVLDDQATLAPTDGSQRVRLSELNRISFYDPSTGGRAAKCEAAIVGMGCDWMQRRMLLDEWSENTTYGKAACRWMQMNDRFRFHKNYYELVGAQKSIEDVVNLMNIMMRQGLKCPHCGAAHRPMRIEGVKPPGGSNDKNKDDRIRTHLQDHAEAGRIYTRQNTHRKFKTQYSHFPHGTLKDVLDAVAWAAKMIKAPVSADQQTTERSDHKRQQMMSKPRTHTSVDYGGY